MHDLGPSQNYQPPPQTAKIAECLEQPFEIEKLRLAVCAVIVLNGRFRKAQPGILKTLHHLDTDCAASRCKANTVVARSPHQPEVAIHVSNLYSKRDSYNPTVN